MKRIILLLSITFLVGLATNAHADETRHWVPTLCEAADELHRQPVNLDALAYAVAVAESGNCKTGVGASKNNCHSIKKNGEYAAFNSTQESFAYFKYMWKNSRYYEGSFPNCREAETYLGHKNIDTWLVNVWRAHRFYLSSFSRP